GSADAMAFCAGPHAAAAPPAGPRRRPHAPLGPDAAGEAERGGEELLEVRNTFIHGGLARSPSLEAFYREREVASCPGCRSGCLKDLFHEEVMDMESDRCGPSDSTTVTPVLTPRSGSSETASSAAQHGVWQCMAPVADEDADGFVPRSGWSETESNAAQHTVWQYMSPMIVPGMAQAALQQAVLVHDPAATTTYDGTASWPFPAGTVGFQPWAAEEETAAPFVVGAPDAPPAPHGGRMLVRLADTLLADGCGPPPRGPRREPHPAPPAEAAPGSEELPSVGSAHHGAGHCKPCAFVHSKGCADGPLCQFCHLCEPGEKKRRQREKLKCRKAAFQGRRAGAMDF
ncbi:unnamed protein product, partial [Prorocentrum cordatum]